MAQIFLTNEDMEKMELWIGESDGTEGFDAGLPEGCKLMLVSNDEQGEGASAHFLTNEDVDKLIQEVIVALGTPVFGTVDSEKNIILSGDLVAGTYTVKYENEDGSTTEIGSVTVS